jgi:hypothetical protein
MRSRLSQCVAATLGFVIVTAAAARPARADDARDATLPGHPGDPLPPPPEPPSPQEKAACQQRLQEAEATLDRDAKYARDWQAAWLVTGASLMALSAAKAGMQSDYRRGEDIVFAVSSGLLMIQVPTATTSDRALQGLRTAQTVDPCLALPSTRYMFDTNEDDGVLHRGIAPHIIGIALNLITGAVVALASQHWDFVGHGSEGMSTLVGIAASELQIWTYPRGSMHAQGTSLAVSF